MTTATASKLAVTADLDATVRTEIGPTTVGVWLRDAAR